jgi:hypothetical protein
MIECALFIIFLIEFLTDDSGVKTIKLSVRLKIIHNNANQDPIN